MAAVTLAELKQYMRKSTETSDDDQLLQTHLDAAAGVVAYRTNGADPDEPMRVYDHRGVLLLPAAGLHEVSTITDPAGNDVDLASVDVDLEAGIITLRSCPTRSGFWTVTITADEQGRAPLRLATMIIAEHLWGLRRGTAGGGARDAAQVRRGDDAPIPIGFAVPNRAAELIAPYSMALGFA